MLTSTKDFTEYLTKDDTKFTDKGTTKEGDDVISVRFECDNVQNIGVTVFFSKSGKNAALRVFNLAKIPKDKVEVALRKINELNRQYKYVKFCLDPENNSVDASADVIFEEHDIGKLCATMLYTMVGICDRNYKELMKTIWED